MLRADSVRRSAMTRRRPMIFTSSVPLRASRVALARAFIDGGAPLRGARGERGVDVARLDAARGTRARDGRQVETGFGGAAAAGRRRHDAPGLVRAGAVGAGRRGLGGRRDFAFLVGRRATARHFGLVGCAALRGQGFRRRRRRRLRGRRIAGGGRGGVGVEHHQLRAHGHHVAGLPGDGEDAAGDRRGHFDRGLLGHDFAHDLVFLHEIAGLHVPGDDFRGNRAFAEIRHLEYVAAH